MHASFKICAWSSGLFRNGHCLDSHLNICVRRQQQNKTTRNMISIRVMIESQPCFSNSEQVLLCLTSLLVSMPACMSARLCACVCVCVSSCVRAWLRVCLVARMCGCLAACLHACLPACLPFCHERFQNQVAVRMLVEFQSQCILHRLA